ncbi:MAG: hypothetical protein HY996_11110 [Micrococcales bacterium]|nr:hypothetical protein [Micrococcales bacterium]
MTAAIAPAALAMLGILAAAVAVLVCRHLPRFTVVVWMAVLFFAPVWIGVTIGPFWALLSLVTLVAVVSNLDRLSLAPADLVVALFSVLVVVLFALGRAALSSTVTALVEWVLPYLWGRVVVARVRPDFLYSTISVAAVLAAILALVEFGTGRNPFVALPPLGPSYAIWGTLQDRGGFLRAEGAFGHSIALGASLAISTAFVLASPWRSWLRVLTTALVSIATIATLSRIGMVTAALTVALSLVLLRSLSRAARVAYVALGLLTAIVVLPVLTAVFSDAGQEAAGSAAYRGDLLSILPSLVPFGSADSLNSVSSGVYLGDFANSVDNAVLVVAIRFGVIPALLLVVLAAMAVVTLVVRGRATPASVAVAAQIPALVGVAMITQYGMFLWFVGGLAVALDAQRSGQRASVSSGFAPPAIPPAPAIVSGEETSNLGATPQRASIDSRGRP